MRISLKDKPFEVIDFQAVLFDLDGTLVESTRLIGDILTQWAVEQDLDAEAVLLFSHGKRTQDIVAHFISDNSFELHYQTLTKKFLEASIHTKSIEAAASFIQALDDRRIPWAVVSSSERELIYARMNAAGLPKPTQIVAAEDIIKGKPDPEGYLKGANILNVPIERCLVFEDSPSGIQAVKAAGAQLIIIGKSKLGLSIIKNFAEMKFVLEDLSF